MSKSIQERLKSLERQYKGLCCKVVNLQDNPSEAGCISFTDITWTEFITQIENGTIADCYYNITDRPNSGNDPLYVLVEKGLPNFDNEVRRGTQALASFCINEKTGGSGCFNLYASTDFSFIASKYFCAIVLDCKASPGDIITFPEVPGSPSYTVAATVRELIYFQEACPRVSPGQKVLVNGKSCTLQEYFVNEGNLQLGQKICSGDGLQAEVTAYDSITGQMTINPTSGSWVGVTQFWDCEKGPKWSWYMPAIPEPTSTPLNSEPICFSNSILGDRPYSAQMLLASNGDLYGVLSSGAKYGQLYKIDTATDVITILIEFNDQLLQGSSPSTSLVEEAGIIYGTTTDGGVNNNGVIWQYELATGLFSKLFDFEESPTGSYPYSGQVIVSGVIYGITENGGSSNRGTLYSYEIATNTFTSLKDLGNENVLYPQGTLVEVLPGKLWGTSYQGGFVDAGTVFQYDIATNTVEIIYSLDDEGYKAAQASGGVFLASDGNVYLQTMRGGSDTEVSNYGLLIRIENVGTTNNVVVVREFDEYTGGYSDAVRPVEIAGILYGVTSERGRDPFNISCEGTLWSLDLSDDTFTILQYFQTGIINPEGFTFYNSLQVVGTNLYGLTSQSKDTKYDRGTIFKYNTLTDTRNYLKYFSQFLGNEQDIALIVCSAIDNPAYTCTVIDGCVYVTGSQYAEDNGQVLEVRTIYTLDYVPYGDQPTVGNTILFGNGDNSVLGTIIDFDPLTGHMRVEWLSDNYVPNDILNFIYEEQENGNQGDINGVSGSQVVYTSTPFTGGDPFPHNMPCYYNAAADIIVDYPMSQAFTKAEIQKFIADKTLVPGAFYYIKGLDPSLYGGTTCILQAVSPNTFDPRGMGLFHTPDYNKYRIFSKETAELGLYQVGDVLIWGGQYYTYTGNNGEMEGYISPYLLTSQFDNGATTSIIFVDPGSTSGSWNIGDEVSVYDTTATILDLYINEDTYGPSYLILNLPFSFSLPNGNNTIYNDTTGGQIDASGNIVTSIFNIPNYTGYNEQWEEITYDQDRDFITSRKDSSLNYVEQSYEGASDISGDYLTGRSIRAFQWGYPFNPDYYRGAGHNTVVNSIFETINMWTDTAIVHNNVLNYSNVYFPLGSSFISDFVGNTFEISYFADNGAANFWQGFTNNKLYNSGLSQCYFMGSMENNIFNNSGLQVPINSLFNVEFSNVYYGGDLTLATKIYNPGVLKVMQDNTGVARVAYVNGSGSFVADLITT